MMGTLLSPERTTVGESRELFCRNARHDLVPYTVSESRPGWFRGCVPGGLVGGVVGCGLVVG
jgi:hypothetical protein